MLRLIHLESFIKLTGGSRSRSALRCADNKEESRNQDHDVCQAVLAIMEAILMERSKAPVITRQRNVLEIAKIETPTTSRLNRLFDSGIEGCIGQGAGHGFGQAKHAWLSGIVQYTVYGIRCPDPRSSFHSLVRSGYL